MDEKPIIDLLTKIDKKMSLLVGEKIKEKESSIKDQVALLYKKGLSCGAKIHRGVL